MMLFCLAQIVCFAVINWCEKWPRERKRDAERESPRHTLTQKSPERAGERAREEVAPLWSRAGFWKSNWTIAALLWRRRRLKSVRKRRLLCCAAPTGSRSRSSSRRRGSTIAGPTNFLRLFPFQRDTRAKTLSVRATQRFADAPAEQKERKKERGRVASERERAREEPAIRRL